MNEEMARATHYLTEDIPRQTATGLGSEEFLAKSKRVLAALGNPQDEVPAIHLAGTSGKGSTGMALSALLVAHGQAVGLTLSPHVYDIRERAQINGQLAPAKVFVDTVESLKPRFEALARAGDGPSFFEATVGVAATIFATSDLDYAIYETGLGGRYDTTNAITRSDKLSLLTAIGFDHQAVLGNSLTEIASQKAGILWPGGVALSVEQPGEVRAVFEREARDVGCDLMFVPAGLPPGLTNPQLQGAGQGQNVALALAAARQLARRDGWKFDEAIALKALNSLRLPGRFELVNYGRAEVIFDGAHNKQKMANLAGQLKAHWPDLPISAVVAFGQGRDAAEAMQPLLPLLERLIVTRYEGFNPDQRVSPAEPRSLDFRRPVEVLEDHAAVAEQILTQGGRWVVTGSFYLLAQLKTALEAAESAHA